MNWGKAIAVWMLIVLAESIHGAIRELFIAPAIGDMLARQIGVFVGSALILLVAWLTASWLDAATLKDQLSIGALWVALIVIFEISLGLSLGYTRERMLSDYDITQGGLMAFGLVLMLFAPSIGARLRSLGRQSARNASSPATAAGRGVGSNLRPEPRRAGENHSSR